MALAKQNVPISFLQGIDTKDDRKQVVPGKLLLLENGIFTTPGKIRKRNGYVALSNNIDSGSSISAAASLMNFQSELLETDGQNLFSYDASNQKWTERGPMISFEVESLPIIRNTYQQTTPDSAQHSSGLRVFTWEDSRGTARYAIIDSITGQTIVQDTALEATSVKPKVLPVGQYLVIFYIRTSDHHLRYVAIPVASPLVPNAAADFATNVDTINFNYDAIVLSTKIFVTYNNSDGGGGITVRDMNAFLMISTGTDQTGENADTAINIFADSTLQQVWIAYHNGTDTKYFIKSYSLTSILAPTTIETVANLVRLVGYANNGSGKLLEEISAVATYNHFIRAVTLTNTGTVGTPAVFIRSLGLAAKPFVIDGIYYLPTAFSTVEQPTYFILRAQDAKVVAKYVPTNGGGLLTKNIVPESNSIGNSQILTSALIKDLLTTVSGSVYTQTGLTSIILDFASVNTYSRVELGDNLHISAGSLYMYDGVNIVEHGFNMFPENVTFTQSNAGGNLGSGSVDTQYQFSITYEWTDNQGQIHRSAPSIPTTVSFSSGVTTGSVTLTIPTLRVTSKTGVQIVVYRTEGNGTVFYRDSSVTSPIINDPTVDTQSFTSTQSDASIIGNPLLYTTGGVVENIQAPASSFVIQYKDRVILIPSESPLEFWYSKQIVPGAPVEFSDLFVESIDQRGGNVTGIEQLDDKLILFKFSSIFFILGNGPDATGAQNDFTEAQLITTDGGCINNRSIVIMPQGLMYQSQKGFYLLGRNLGVQYIGAPVEAFNNDVTTSANLIPNTTQVRFTLASGVSLVYDYFVNQWSVFTNQHAVDSVVFQEAFTYAQPGGLVMQETPDHFTDNTSFIKLKLVTSWLSMSGLQGFQRAYRALFLGEYISPHKLLLNVSYDFDDTSAQQVYIDSTVVFPDGITAYGEDSPYGAGSPYGGSFPLYQFRLDFIRQKCQAIQFTIEDVQESNFGEGMSLSSFNLMVGMKQGSNKVPTNRIFS